MSDIPTHIGIILDGNRRWAKAQDLPAFKGHEQGSENLKEIALASFERGVKVVSAFVFSTENWKRAEEEVGFLMKLVILMSKKHLADYHKKGIRIVVLGSRIGVKPDVIKAAEKAEDLTKGNKKGTLALCFNYGGQNEIVDAAKKAIEAKVDPGTLNAEEFAKYLYDPEVPPVDLLIRTSGEQRTSGFMLWRAAYAELRFVDKHWPDFTEKDLDEAIADYAGRHRRFGS